MAHLEQWSLRGEYLQFIVDPEGESFLMGVVTNHPIVRDATAVMTNTVTAFSLTCATTLSGTKYTLGEVDPKYKSWLGTSQGKEQQ